MLALCEYHLRMSKEPPPSRTAEQFVVRFPAGMRDRIAEEAKVNGRSMNAEIVARLDASFQADERTEEQAFQEGFEVAALQIEVARLREQLHAERMKKSQERASADLTGKMLEKLPADLVSHYGLQLYRSELFSVQQQQKQVQQQLEELGLQLDAARATGATSANMEDVNQQIGQTLMRRHELEEQANLLKQTLNGIHTYRELNGLPELRNVRRHVASLEIKNRNAKAAPSKEPPASKKG